MTHGSLFSGIGGFDLAAEWAGWNNIFHCEWNPFGQKVLKHYWPKAISYEDITKTNFTVHRGQIDILTGGFPCQPYSQAGKRLGKEDDRHLWPEMLRAIREIQPRYIVGENVSGLVNWNGGMVFNEVQAEMEAEGYEVTPFILPACAVNAPHRRDRVWFVAYNSGKGWSKRNGQETDFQGRKMAEFGQERDGLRNDIGASDKTRSGPTPDTDSDGLNQCNSKHEVKSGKKGEYAQCNIDKSDDNGNATDTPNEGLEGSAGKELQRGGGGFTWNDKKNGIVSNPNSERCDYRGDHREERHLQTDQGTTKENQPEWEGWECGIGEVGSDATNANGIGLRNESNRIGESGFFGQKSKRNYWQDFPTQSPVCDGNDGISSRLDGITFPKWRNESIKAGGNAIVPQVAYQIFQAINKFESL